MKLESKILTIIIQIIAAVVSTTIASETFNLETLGHLHKNAGKTFKTLPSDGVINELQPTNKVSSTDSSQNGSIIRDSKQSSATSEQSDPNCAKKSGERTRKIYDFTKLFLVGTSCNDIQASQGATRTGIYLIHPPNLVQGPWKIFCDMESEGGGWTVFQVRDDVEPHENFMRSWEDYKVGFGDFDREFWLGNILIWALTNVNNNTNYELHIELEDWSGNKRFARYRDFKIDSESNSYQLHHANIYFGNAGDSLFSHNNAKFSTFDTDNDNKSGDQSQESSCAKLYKGGWWYNNCHDSNLNGWYLGGPHRSFADGVNWYTWTGYNYSLKRTVMKFRPQKEGLIPVGFDTFILANKKRSLDLEGKIDVSELLSQTNRLTKPSNDEL